MHIMDRIYVPKNISVCVRFLWILYINNCFASQSYEYLKILVRIEIDKESNKNLLIFCPVTHCYLYKKMKKKTNIYHLICVESL